jgi:hypothetical protein
LLARPRLGQWAGLPRSDARRAAEPLGHQRAALDVETRPLAVYDALVGVTRLSPRPRPASRSNTSGSPRRPRCWTRARSGGPVES